MSEAVFIAVITLFGSIIAGLFKLVNDSNKAQERQNETHAKIASGLEKQAKATTALVKETRKGNKQSAERNGHLGEQNIQITQLITETRTDMLNNLENIKEQHIGKQIVDEQEVNTEIVKTQIKGG